MSQTLREESSEINASTLSIKKIESEMVIHGLFITKECVKDSFIFVALETPDNQLDFN